MRARDIMTSPVMTVRTDTSVQDAARLLAEHGFTALPVVDDDDRLIGIVTEADVVRHRLPRDPRNPRSDRGPVTTAVTVGEVMSTPATGMGQGTDVSVLAEALLEARRRSMPIVDGGRVVGIVTRRDLVRAVSRDDETIARDVRHKLKVYGGPDRWQVSVHQGRVVITDRYDDETDRHIATALAEAVPGVLLATTVGGTDQDDTPGSNPWTS